MDRDDYLISKFKNTSGCCTLESCNFFPGDVVHYLSGACPALSRQLSVTLDNSLKSLSEYPFLIDPVLTAFSKSPEEGTEFLLDPHSNVLVIPIRQLYGSEAIWPLFKLSRAYIWCMHRERSKLMELM